MRGFIEISLYILIVVIASITLGFIGFIGAVLVLHYFIQSRRRTPHIESTAKPTDYTKVPTYYYDAYREYLRSQEWKDLRKLVFKRDNHRCVRCGYIGTKKQCHHTNYEGVETMSFSIDQLETVCHLCHDDIHKGLLPMKKD